MPKTPDPAEQTAKAKETAARLLSSVGLTLIKRPDGTFGHQSVDKKSGLVENFKPSSLTQPAPTPFTINQKVERDGMGVPNPPKRSEND